MLLLPCLSHRLAAHCVVLVQGRMEFVLFSNAAPLAAENFRRMCAGGPHALLLVLVLAACPQPPPLPPLFEVLPATLGADGCYSLHSRC